MGPEFDCGVFLLECKLGHFDPGTRLEQVWREVKTKLKFSVCNFHDKNQKSVCTKCRFYVGDDGYHKQLRRGHN